MNEILLFVLVNRSGQRPVGLEKVVRNAEGLLATSLERAGECNFVVLGVAIYMLAIRREAIAIDCRICYLSG